MRGKWQARVTRLGRQVAIGTYPTRQEALDALARARVDAQRGRRIDPSGSRVRLEEVALSWWATRGGHRPSTRQRDRTALDHHILPALGRAQLGQLARREIQDWVNSQAAHGASASVRRNFTVLSQILDAAVDSGLIGTNPAKGAKLPRRQQEEAHFLDTAELEFLADTIDVRYRAMVLVMAWATLRIGEAAGLRRRDLDLRAGRLTVANNVVEVAGKLHEGPPKTKAGRRTMTLPASVAADLRTHIVRFAATDYVFPQPNGGALHAQDWRRNSWHPAVDAAGLAPLRPHDMKHTGVALLAAAGVDPSEIARRAGHSSVAFTYHRYGHLFPEIDRDAAAKLDAVRLASRDKGMHETG